MGHIGRICYQKIGEDHVCEKLRSRSVKGILINRNPDILQNQLKKGREIISRGERKWGLPLSNTKSTLAFFNEDKCSNETFSSSWRINCFRLSWASFPTLWSRKMSSWVRFVSRDKSYCKDMSSRTYYYAAFYRGIAPEAHLHHLVIQHRQLLRIVF